MSGSVVLLHLAGAVALMLFATRLVKTGVERAYGDVLRHRLRATMRNPLMAVLVGCGLAVALQSSTAVTLLVGSFAWRFGLGWDAFWYLAELRAVGYVPFVVMPLLVVWLAGTAQLAALATRRYAPYPAASELPPRGPLRKVVRTTTLALRDRRRRGPVGVPEALEG